jgi:8-amino-7-oxononanoate synthase
MRDFSSALYLGMHHSSQDMGRWDALTLGRPAAMEEPPRARAVCVALARLQGAEASVLLPSTLHLFWDLFGMLAKDALVILVDAGAYPISRWGADRARCLGMPLVTFPCGSDSKAADLADKWIRAGRRPVILTDGFSPGAGGSPPLASYARIVQKHDGLLVVDDTQSLGIVGADGGGSAAAHDVRSNRLVIGASLAKGFGAPIAALSASQAMVDRFVASSQTRVHTSPPSAAAIQAASCALDLNRRYGSERRKNLWQRIKQFQTGIAKLRLVTSGGDFPVQILHLNRLIDGRALYESLKRRGVLAILQSAHTHTAIAFLLRADHSSQDIEFALCALDAYFQEVLWNRNLKPCHLQASSVMSPKWKTKVDTGAGGPRARDEGQLAS